MDDFEMRSPGELFARLRVVGFTLKALGDGLSTALDQLGEDDTASNLNIQTVREFQGLVWYPAQEASRILDALEATGAMRALHSVAEGMAGPDALLDAMGAV